MKNHVDDCMVTAQFFRSWSRPADSARSTSGGSLIVSKLGRGETSGILLSGVKTVVTEGVYSRKPSTTISLLSASSSYAGGASSVSTLPRSDLYDGRLLVRDMACGGGGA